MNGWGWVVAVLAILIVMAVGDWTLRGRRRLRERFGPEYERALAESPSRSEAESELEERVKRREGLEIRPLDEAAVGRYEESWRTIQAHFVDKPAAAVREADGLVTEVLKERGYPIEEFDQRAADISVDHPYVVENYRQAHAISQANEQSEVGTEHLRRAMVHYRSLFQELLESEKDNNSENTTTEEAC